MKRLTMLLLGLALIGLWGCSKDAGPNEPQSSDEQAITEVIESYEASETEDYFYSSLDDESEDYFTGPSMSFSDYSLEKAIVPLRFGRISRPIKYDLRIVLTSDSTATAIYTHIQRGWFKILAADTSSTPDTALVYRVWKPLGHKFTRIAHFVKRSDVPENVPARRGWRMVDFSMVLGESLGRVDSTIVASTITITKLIVDPDNGDPVEITDPLEYFQNRETVFSFPQGTEVHFTVHVNNTTANPVIFPQGTESTELVRLHFGRHHGHKLYGFRYFTWTGQDVNGDNIYEGTWTTQQRVGVHHAVIDVIDNGTIRDDDVDMYPYNSTTWGTPYLIKMNN